MPNDEPSGGLAPRVIAVAPYGVSSASTRVRLEEWLRRLAPAARRSYYLGTAHTQPSMLARRPGDVLRAEAALRHRLDPKGGVLILHREASPLSRGGAERALLRRATRAVYDLDDALHLDVRGSRMRRFFKSPAKYTGIAALADVVIAGNDLLADWATEHCASVTVVPTCVEPEAYVQKTNYHVGDPPLIGWVGSFSGIPELERFAPPLEQLHRRTGARLEVLGTGAPLPAGLAAFGSSIPWSEAEAARRLATWDVGVMPLLDLPFNRGKSAYKLLQYAAAGLPCVATPLGVNASVLTKMGAPGPLTQDEWFDALLQQVTATAFDRRRLGRRARAVATSYSYAAWSTVWRQTVLE